MTRKNLVVVFFAVFLMMVISVNAQAAKQPHMKAGLEHLAKAKAKLEEAKPDKGGHREQAIKLIDEAMEEVKKGIEYANTH